MLLFLLEEYPDYINTSSKSGYTPLHLAALKGTPVAVKAMLDHGAIPDTESMVSMTYVCSEFLSVLFVVVTWAMVRTVLNV